MSKLLIVAGPTTSGKTTRAHAWAEENDAVLIDEGKLEMATRHLRLGLNVALVINLPSDTTVEVVSTAP